MSALAIADLQRRIELDPVEVYRPLHDKFENLQKAVGGTRAVAHLVEDCDKVLALETSNLLGAVVLNEFVQVQTPRCSGRWAQVAIAARLVIAHGQGGNRALGRAPARRARLLDG